MPVTWQRAKNNVTAHYNVPPTKLRFLLIVPLLFAITVLVVVLFHHYQDTQMRAELEATRESVANLSNASEERVSNVQAQLAEAEKQLGAAQRELEKARTLANQMQSHQENNGRGLSEQISEKADLQDVARLEQSTSSQIGNVIQNVGLIRKDVQGLRRDLNHTQKDVSDLSIIAREHGRLIAANAEGLQSLRRRGEREYFVFDINKREQIKQVGDVRLELRDTDSKHNRADIRIYVHDIKLDRSKVRVNEPVDVAPRNGLDYEVVINQVVKDRISGYISAPKKRSVFSTAKSPLQKRPTRTNKVVASTSQASPNPKSGH